MQALLEEVALFSRMCSGACVHAVRWRWPDELVWNNLKNHGVGRRSFTGPDHLKHIVLNHLRALLRNPMKVRGFIQEPHTKYAVA